MKKSTAKRNSKLMTNDLHRLTDSFLAAKPGEIHFVIYDNEQTFRKILKELPANSDTSPEHLKYKPAKKPEPFFNKLRENVAEHATMLSHLYLSGGENPKVPAEELLPQLSTQLSRQNRAHPLWLIIPISFLKQFCQYAGELWHMRRNLFWVEARDIDRFRMGFFLTDHFWETSEYRDIDDKKYILQFYKMLQAQFAIDESFRYLQFSMLGKIAGLHFQTGNYARSLQVLNEQHNLLKHMRDEKLLPELLNNIAVVFHNMGRINDALERFQLAMKAAEKSLRGAHHPGKIMLTSNYGALCSDINDIKEAFMQTRHALRMGESKIGMRHEGLIPLLINYARALRDRGDFEDSLDQYRRGLKIVELRLSIDHPYMSVILQHIGMVYYFQKNYDLARRYVYRTLEAMERSLGAEHPYLGRLFNNIGVTHMHGEKLDLALKYFQWALNIRHKRVGDNDPLIGFIHSNIGQVYAIRGETEAAQLCYLRAREILRKHLPENHKELANIDHALESLNESIVTSTSTN